MANLEETVLDLELGRENGQMKPLILRYQVFVERMEDIFSEFRKQSILGKGSLQRLVLRGEEYLKRMYNFISL